MLAPEPGFEVVGEASNGTEAVSLALELRPDVVLMELCMPELDGATATAEIRAERPATQVLVLTTYDTDAEIVRAIDAGAIGYLLKDVPHEGSRGPYGRLPAESQCLRPPSPNGS